MLRGSRFLLWMDMRRSQSFSQNQLLKFLHQVFPIALFLALDDGTLFRHRSQECRQMAWKRLSCVLALASPELFYFFPPPGTETTLPMSLHVCTTLGKVLEARKVWQDSWDTLGPVTSPKSGQTICQARSRPLWNSGLLRTGRTPSRSFQCHMNTSLKSLSEQTSGRCKHSQSQGEARTGQGHTTTGTWNRKKVVTSVASVPFWNSLSNLWESLQTFG